MVRLSSLICLLLAVAIHGQALAGETTATVFCFYYPWYGTPEVDGEYRHWDHEVIGADPAVQYSGEGTDIGANYIPADGVYSSNDPEVVGRHMQQMSEAGIDVVVTSWWGAGSFEDQATPLVMDKAAEHGLDVCFHLEPYASRDTQTTLADIRHLVDTYGEHPAFYRDEARGSRPVMFVYDSYLTDAGEWASVLTADGADTIRGTEYDAVLLGLWVEPHHDDFILNGGFDGFYSYFAVDGFTYASNTTNWPHLAEWAGDNDMLFIPCVGPGYMDTRIRPWNTANTREREDGEYYNRMFRAAAAVRPEGIGITSFNEWHEGTQIEPARIYIIPWLDWCVMHDIEYTEDHGYSPIFHTIFEEYKCLEMTAYWTGLYRQYVSGEVDDLPVYAEPEQVIEQSEHLARDKPVTLTPECSPKYDAGIGGAALVDGWFASMNYRDGRWVGFEGTDVVVEIDLEEVTVIEGFSIKCLEDPGAWIFAPLKVDVEASADGNVWQWITGCEFEEFRPVISDGRSISTYVGGSQFPMLVASFFPVDARYVRVTIDSIETCPDWHDGAGQPAWVFVDEVFVE